MLIKVSKFVATIFYLIGIVGSLILFGKFDDFNYAMSSFFGFDSFEEVTNTMIFVFLLANISIGIIIHLLAEILSFMILIYLEKKNNKADSKVVESISDQGTMTSNINAESTEKEELNLFYSLLLKIQNMFNKR